jgi:hypothetical protein
LGFVRGHCRYVYIVGRAALAHRGWPEALRKKKKEKRKEKGSVRRPGIEPGSTAWKATMLTITPATLSMKIGGADVGIIGRGTGAFAGPWPPV